MQIDISISCEHPWYWCAIGARRGRCNSCRNRTLSYSHFEGDTLVSPCEVATSLQLDDESIAQLARTLQTVAGIARGRLSWRCHVWRALLQVVPAEAERRRILALLGTPDRRAWAVVTYGARGTAIEGPALALATKRV